MSITFSRWFFQGTLRLYICFTITLFRYIADWLVAVDDSFRELYDYNHQIFPTDILTDLLLPMIFSGYYLYHQIFSTDIPTDLLLLTPVKDCGQDSEFWLGCGPPLKRLPLTPWPATQTILLGPPCHVSGHCIALKLKLTV